MDKRDARFYYEGGKSLKEKVNVAVGGMLWLEKVIYDEERTSSARKDARKEWNRLENHKNVILEHYNKIEAQLRNEHSEFLTDLRSGFRFDE